VIESETGCVDINRMEHDIKIRPMKKSIVCFGEVLWDIFPDRRIIGGAPLNVALRLKSFGNQVAIISAVGNDYLGLELTDYLKSQGLSTDAIQISKHYATGEVTVMLNNKGSASYDIEFPRAWDKIDVSAKDIALVKACDIFIFGSLAARNELTHHSLLMLLQHAAYKVFDVNLRAPYYSIELLKELMQKADFIKFNDEELYEIGESLGSESASLEQNMYFMSEYTGCKRVCVTKGRHGAALLYDGEMYYNSGYHVKVVDTVGAGDSFLATLLTYLSVTGPKEALDYACAMGALVAATKGANEKIAADKLEEMVRASAQETH